MHQALCLKLWGKHSRERRSLKFKISPPNDTHTDPGTQEGRSSGCTACVLGALLERNQGTS